MKLLMPDPESTASEIYERGIDKLIEIVSRIHNSGWSPTESRKTIEAIAKKLEETAELLVSGSAQFDIETFHDERGIPEPVIGLDGYPIEQPTEWEWPSYQSIKWDIRLLAESARLATEQLPDPRKKPAQEFAARGLLHLRHDYGFQRVSLYDNGIDVIELKRVCERAGIVLSRERYRGLLAESLKTFDPYFIEPGYDLIYK